MQKDKDITTSYIDSLDEYIGARIRLIRKQHALSIEQLSKKTGITCSRLSNYEHGQAIIQMDMLYMIAKALKTPIGWFFEGYGNQSPVPEALEIPELFELLSLFSTIKGVQKRHKVLKLLRIATNSTLPMSEYAKALSILR